MDSINKQQPEDNFKNLIGEEAHKKIADLAKKAGSCFFCTKIQTGQPFRTRPMAADHFDDDGNFYFLSASDSHKNRDIATDPYVQLLFQGSAHSDFLTLFGKAEISVDREKIEELWNPFLKVWFTEGKDDPRITVIKVTPTQGYYWDTQHGMAAALIKRTYGAVVGETYDDSVEGTIDPS